MNNINKDVYMLPTAVNTWSKTKPKEKLDEKFTFAWTIEKFNSRLEGTGESLNSNSFIMRYEESDEIKWKFRIYPKGIISRHFLSVFLDFDSEANIKDYFHK